MNLGSSKKWIELLRSGDFNLNDGVGLRWKNDTFSPVGVLENFITRTWKLSPYSDCYANIDGKILLASTECLKKVKAKTDLEIIDDLACNGIEFICNFIETNYETL